MVEAVNEGSYPYPTHHRWSPAQVTVSTVGGVTISNPTSVYHGVNWISPPATPSCDSGVPVGTTAAASATNWKGACTFTTPGTYTYYCTVHGPEMTGTITVKAPGTPTAVTGVPTEKTQTTARLGGTVKPEGNFTSYYFKYRPTAGSEQKTPLEGAGPPDFGEHSVSVALTGLKSSTEYQAELVVVYGAGKTEVSGGEQTFTTPAATAPTVATTSATVEGESKATLHGTVDPNGGQATQYFFEYGKTESYGSHTAPVGGLLADNANHAASATISGGSPSEEELKPGTTYHFRLVASNEAGGPSHGEDRTFTTLSPPPKEPEPMPAPNPSPSPGPSPGPSVPLVTQPTTETGTSFAPALIGGSLKLSGHGTSVRGSIGVGLSGAGGRLEVDLIANSAALARRGRSKQVVVGRLVRASVPAGKVPFSVTLNPRAKSALRRRHRLALTVRIVLKPAQGTAATISKSVLLRA